MLKAADLQILIRLDRRDAQTALTYVLKAREPELKLNFREFGPIRLHGEPRQHFEEAFKEISELSLRDDEARDQARLRLQAKGAGLARALLPDDLLRTLRDLVGKVASLEIQSDEAWIPWEILRLPDEEDGLQVGGIFLCEAFALTRWRPGVEEHHDLPLRNLAVIAPTDSGLDAAAEEIAFLESLSDERRLVKRVAARYRAVVDEMSRGELDGWHFTGHGVARSADPNLWPILLDGGDKLRPEDLNGEAANLGRSRPLVFLNGCHTARGAPSLTHVGGWAEQFLQAGAGAFVGASWATRDESARAFAEGFYRRFLEGSSFGEAVRDARLDVRERFPGDPTWLSFVAYGHPLAQCREPRRQSRQDRRPTGAPVRGVPLPSGLSVPRPSRPSAVPPKALSSMKKTPQPVALILFLAVLLSGLGASPLRHLILGPSESEISVRVVGPGRAPIQGAEVILFARGGPYKGVTSTLGAARLSSPSPEGRLVVQSPGFKIHEELLNHPPDDFLDIELRPRESDAGKVLFRIVAAAGGAGIAGAEVQLIQGARPSSKVSDSNGLVDFNLEFDNGEAEVLLTVEALGFAFEDHRLTVRPDTSQDVVLNRRDRTLSLSPFGSG